MFSAGLTLVVAVAIVVVGRVVLLGYEAFFDGLARNGRNPSTNQPVQEVVHQAPTPTPHVADDFVPDFFDEPDYYDLPFDEPLPDALFITPLYMLNPDVQYSPFELPVVGATGWVASRTGLFHVPPGFVESREDENLTADGEGVEDEYPAADGEGEADEYPAADGEGEEDEYPAAMGEDEPLFFLFGPEDYEQDYEEHEQEILPFLELEEGKVFVILQEWNEWWHVMLNHGVTGWLRREYCFINLPDVIPSIVFNITNATASVKRSGAYEIPGVTGEALYMAFRFNHRFGRHKYIVPALYSTAKRLNLVQQTALENGETLVVYEAFRPHRTQQLIVNRLNDLMRTNQSVSDALNTPPWSPSWFISHGVSHHQRGAAIDASLARVVEYEITYTADFVYAYRRVLSYVMHKMPTPMHDLHPDAATFTAPGTRVFAETMTESAKLLQGFFTVHGFTPLASEWWHFNDVYGVEVARRGNITGGFMTEEILSFPPSFRE